MVFSLFKKTQRTEKKEHCLGLILGKKDGVVMLLALDRNSRKVDKIDERQFEYTELWHHLAENVDEILFQLEQDNHCSIKEVIFFLWAHSVDQKNKKIKKLYLEAIKTLTKELQLKPLGYIDYHEAAAIYFTEREQQAVTALIAEVDVAQISLFLYKNGTLAFSDEVLRSDPVNLRQDFESLFAKIKDKTVLPSRILIYEASKVEEELADIVTHRWREDLFVQIPKLEIITGRQLEEALLFVFSQQLFNLRGEKAIESPSQTVLGFAIGQDVKTKPVTDRKTEPVKAEIREKTPSLKKLTSLTGNFISMIGKRPRMMVFSVTMLVFAALVVFSLVYFFHKASFTVYLQGKTFEQPLTVVGSLARDADQNLLQLTKVEKVTEKKDSIVTTGKKTVGEKSRGEATIYNLTKTEKLFKKGTVVTASRGVRFVLDDEIKVASASENLTTDGNVLTVTGKSKGGLVAENIGTDGNIDKNEKLTIEGFPTTVYFAIPINSFSGGSKRDIQTVSKDDINKLRANLLTQMKEEQDKAVAEAQNSGKIVAQLTQAELTEEDFSKELGEETNNFSLMAKGKVTLYTYNEEDLKKILTSLVSDFVPSEYDLSSSHISYQITKAQEQDQKINLTLTVSAKTVLKLDQQKLVGDILGKKTDEVVKMVKEKYKIQDAKTNVASFIPFLKTRLPFFKKHIVIEITSL